MLLNFKQGKACKHLLTAYSISCVHGKYITRHD